MRVNLHNEDIGGVYMIKQVTSNEDFQEIIKNNPYVLMEFYASWCPHCKAFYPVLNAASEQLEENGVVVAQTEIDTFEQLADEYDVQSIPTLTFFVNGNLVAETSGQRDEQAVFDFVNQARSEA